MENREWLDALSGPHKNSALAELRRIGPCGDCRGELEALLRALQVKG